VAWDRGPVRHGFKVREDGTQVPLWHDSEVAAIAFAIQNILELRTRRNSEGQHGNAVHTEVQSEPLQVSAPKSSAVVGVMAGKKCPECGAHAVIRKDGCEYCTQCGHVGTCG